MQHESSLELLSFSVADRSGLPSRSASEPRQDQPLDEAPLFFSEGTPTALTAVAGSAAEESIRSASRDLLTYVEGMRQRAEKLNGSRSSTNGSASNTRRGT